MEHALAIAKIEKLDVRMEALIKLKEAEHSELRRMHEDNQKILNRLVIALYGDDDGRSGIVSRLHDLEMFISMAKWVVITGGAIVLVNAAQFFLDLFRGK